MGWHYRVRKRQDKGQDIFDIVEYYDDPGAWTTDGIKPLAESYDDLVRELKLMLADARKYPILVEEDNP